MFLSGVAIVFALVSQSAVQAEESSTRERVLGTVVDFAAAEVGPYQQGFLDNWRWPPEFREQASSLSRLEIAADSVAAKSVLRVQVKQPTIFERGPITLLRLAPFYPPEADVLRLCVKVVSGTLRVFSGGPTAYYANSDVYTQTVELTAVADPQWVALDLSLNHPLRRNFRRSGLSTDANRNYYNRWAQEPVGVFLDAGTTGEFLIDRIEVVARGEGRSFPEFAPDEVRPVRTIADFETEPVSKPFTVYIAANETEWFEASWKRNQPLRFEPMQFAVVDDARRGGRVLTAKGRFAEEVHAAGLAIAGTADANAIRLAARIEAPSYNNTLVGAGRAEVIDFLVFVSGKNVAASWQAFPPDAELRKQPGPGFDFQLSHRAIRDRNDLDFAIYQTRRYLHPAEWETLVLPAADFVCIYGSGEYRDRFLQNRPLRCGEATGFAWLSPWCRAGRGNSPVEIRLDDLAFVHVPGTPEQLRSFWQLNESSKVEWREVSGPGRRERIMLLPGDKW